MAMRIVPSADHEASYSHTTKGAAAPSAPGLHDTLRRGVGPSPYSTLAASSDLAEASTSSRHPLESRLKAWEATQQAARMEALRKTFGMAEPIRRGMELKITREGEWRPLALGGGVSAGIHEDVLRGREAFIDWDDVFTGEEQRAAVGVHEEMEKKLNV